MKLRNPITREMIANPKRNQGRHVTVRKDEQESLADLLNEFEEYKYEGYKYTVRYSGDYVLRKAGDGYYAILNATDHPRVGPGHVITSRLIYVHFDLGVLETQNSLYIPEEGE